MNILPMQMTDYPQIIKFWEKNFKISKTDKKENFEILLSKNPDISIIAKEEGKITGTAIGTFDGRKAYLQKIVV